MCRGRLDLLPTLPMRFSLAIALALISGCSKPAPPTVTPLAATVTRIDAQGVEFHVELAVANPNSVALAATDISSRIALNKTQELGTVRLPKAVTLPAGQTTRIEAPVSVSWTNLGSIAQLAAGGNAVPYSVDGTLDLGGALMHVGVPFHIEGSISRDEMIGAALRSFPVLPR
jgi:LEA14-like dessication related protein